ncbi:hypothetical protein C8J57DRAFT_1210696 [Mycena rebaudengoi]|nr:hypothetical protein C8J57DRAFT_1210696 [Mycena rebaudengoi]
MSHRQCHFLGTTRILNFNAADYIWNCYAPFLEIATSILRASFHVRIHIQTSLLLVLLVMEPPGTAFTQVLYNFHAKPASLAESILVRQGIVSLWQLGLFQEAKPDVPMYLSAGFSGLPSFSSGFSGSTPWRFRLGPSSISILVLVSRVLEAVGRKKREYYIVLAASEKHGGGLLHGRTRTCIEGNGIKVEWDQNGHFQSRCFPTLYTRMCNDFPGQTSAQSARRHPVIPGRGGKTEKAEVRSCIHKRSSVVDDDETDDADDVDIAAVKNTTCIRKRKNIVESEEEEDTIDEREIKHRRVADVASVPSHTKGPAPFTAAQIELKKDEVNARRRNRWAELVRPLTITADHQHRAGIFLSDELRRIIAEQLAVSAAFSSAVGSSRQVLAVNAAIRNAQSLSPMTTDPAFRHRLNLVSPMLADLILNPLAFRGPHWVASRVLTRDAGELIPRKIARFYLRVATIPATDSVLPSYIARCPAELSWGAAMSLVQGTNTSELAAVIQGTLTKYNHVDAAALVVPVLHEPETAQFKALFVPLPDGSFTLVYGGMTIASTPLWRLEDDLLFAKYSRFANLCGIKWVSYHIPALDIPAPEGALAFRTNPDIGKWEGLLVNTVRGLGANTTPGGTWIPAFKPPIHLENLAAAVNVPYLISSPEGLSIPRAANIYKLLDEEYNYWANHESASVCVLETLQSIKENLVDAAAWTVQGSVVMVTVAEDITKEEREGKVKGIESSTAGPTMQEAAHIMRLLHPQCTPVFTPTQLRQARGPFCNLFRLSDPVNPRTIPRRIELAKILGVVFLMKNRSPLSYQTPGIQMESRFTTTTFTRQSDSLSSYNPGCIKHDPWFATEYRCIIYLVMSGVVEPAKAIVAKDLSVNGPMPQQDCQAWLARLLQIHDAIVQHMDSAGITLQLVQAKVALRSHQIPVAQIRRLHFRRKLAGIPEGEETSTCPEEEEEELTNATRRPKQTTYTATGQHARAMQLAKIIEDQVLSAQCGCITDPHGFLLLGMTVTSPEFRSHFMGLRDGQDLIQTGKILGANEQKKSNQLANQAKIGPWNQVQAAIRNIPMNRLQAGQASHAQLFCRALHALADPSKLVNNEFLLSWHYGTCPKCKEVVIGCDQNATHYCASDSTSLTLTATNFPSLIRVVFIHDILNNPVLSACIPSDNLAEFRNTLVSSTVSDIFFARVVLKRT